MVAALVGVVIGLSGLGMHFNPDADLDTSHVEWVRSHEAWRATEWAGADCSADCGVPDLD